MYHEVTFEQRKRRRRLNVIAVVVIVAVIVTVLIGINAANASLREQSTLSVRNSVIEASKQCCAIEGSYPSSLEHLEQYYGLVINHDDYVVSYEWLGDNILPSVVVTAR